MDLIEDKCLTSKWHLKWNKIDFNFYFLADTSKKCPQNYKYEMSESSESSSSTTPLKPSQYHRAQSLSDSQSYHKISLPHTHSSISYNGDQSALENDNGIHQTSINCRCV